jgi:ribosome biogenesis GTPase
MNVAAALRSRVVVTHGRQLRVRLPDGAEVAARPAQRAVRAVCGDWVLVRHDERHGEWLVSAVEPRSSALYRSNARGGGELVAANLTMLLIVAAPVPQTDPFIIDRYLAAAHCAGLHAVVVLNKCELPRGSSLDEELAGLQDAGYALLEVSAHGGHGLGRLRSLLIDQCTMLAGESGTGKSSLLRALVPDAEVLIGDLARDQSGRHTTTATRLYALPLGGELLDSPGVRDFAPAVDRLEPRALGFIEVEALARECRFADCQHMAEPDCRVRAAVGTRISARRYESYRRLRRLYERLRPRPGAQRS